MKIKANKKTEGGSSASLLVCLCSCALLLLGLSWAFADSTTPVNSTDYSDINLPTTVYFGGAATNLYGGWSSTNLTTNVTTTWSASLLSMVNTTNVTTNVTTRYAKFYAKDKSKVPLQIEYTNSVAGTSNLIVGVAKSITDGSYATNQVEYYTNRAIGTSKQVAYLLIDMTGFNYGQIISIQNEDTNTAHWMTLTLLAQSNKRN